MREMISAIVVDPERSAHDYALVTLDLDPRFAGRGYVPKGFELKVVEGSDRILETIWGMRWVDCIVTVGPTSAFNADAMNAMPYEYRKKWTHIGEFDPAAIVSAIVNVFANNVDRPRELPGDRLFSVFTCTYRTGERQFDRLYKSLLAQTYPNWDWYILDDTPNSSVVEMISGRYRDPRIRVFRNFTDHGVIGFNKNAIASAADGDYLVEADHDDELVPDCLETLLRAFVAYPDTDFAYSDALELENGVEVTYGPEGTFSYGQGRYRRETVLGKERTVAVTSPLNAASVRGIHACPNHVRCWKRDFYHRIGGHNRDLGVLDDYDICARTFLEGVCTKVDRTLYVQYEDGPAVAGSARGAGTAQSARFGEIQRTNILLSWRYDGRIHERILSMGHDDPLWDASLGVSTVFVTGVPAGLELPDLCHVYRPDGDKNGQF